MNASKIACILALVFAAACSGAPPPPAAGSNDAASQAAVRPNTEAAKAHLAKHVTFPATRAEILAACADTKEFTEGEKRWFADNLPDGKYESADQVAALLKL